MKRQCGPFSTAKGFYEAIPRTGAWFRRSKVSEKVGCLGLAGIGALQPHLLAFSVSLFKTLRDQLRSLAFALNTIHCSLHPGDKPSVGREADRFIL